MFYKCKLKTNKSVLYRIKINYVALVLGTYSQIARHIYHFEVYVLGSQEDGTKCAMLPPRNNTVLVVCLCRM